MADEHHLEMVTFADNKAASEQQQEGEKKPLLQKAKEKLVDTLPSLTSVDVGDLKERGVALWLAALHLALYLTVGLYLLSTGTITEFGRKFPSLSADSSSVCESIPVSVTGQYFADMKGIWNTNSVYDSEWPFYALTLTGTKVTDEQYTRVMQNFTAQLRACGDRTANLDIIGSQIAWSLFGASDANTKIQLETTAKLDQIFASTSEADPVISSAEGVCQNRLITAKFDFRTLTLTATFPDHDPPSAAPSPRPKVTRASSPKVSPSPLSPAPSTASTTRASTDPPDSDDSGFNEFCPEQLSVGNGSFGLRSSPTRSLDVDLASAVTAFALNFGIIDTSSLTKTYWYIDKTDGVLEEQWANDNYPQMWSVTCYSKPGVPRVCYAVYRGSYVYPVLYTYDFRQSEACLCPRDAKNYNCNQGNHFRLALVFQNTGGWESILNAGWMLQRMMQGPDGPNGVKSLVSGLDMTASKLYGNSSLYNDWLQGKEINKAMPYNRYADSFRTLGPRISILSFGLNYGGNNAFLNAQAVKLSDLATSHYNVTSDGTNSTYPQVTCTDTIFRPQALQRMSLEPPVGVVQPYLSCHPTLGSAFLTAAGLAAANSALASSILLGLAVTLIVQYFNHFRKESKIVSPSDKAERAAETEKLLHATVDRLQAEVKILSSELKAVKVSSVDDKVLAKQDAMSAELVAIKALLQQSGLQQQQYHYHHHHQQQQQQQHRPTVERGRLVHPHPPSHSHHPPASLHEPSTSPHFSPRASGASEPEHVYGENPLHRRNSGRGSIGIAAARLSQTGTAPSAEELADWYEALQSQREHMIQAGERRHSVAGGSFSS